MPSPTRGLEGPSPSAAPLAMDPSRLSSKMAPHLYRRKTRLTSLNTSSGAPRGEPQDQRAPDWGSPSPRPSHANMAVRSRTNAGGRKATGSWSGSRHKNSPQRSGDHREDQMTLITMVFTRPRAAAIQEIENRRPVGRLLFQILFFSVISVNSVVNCLFPRSWAGTSR